MATLNIHQAKTHFSKLIERVHLGEEIIIAKAGRPIAKLVPYSSESDRRRIPGLAAGEVFVSHDFDAPLPDDLLAEFEK